MHTVVQSGSNPEKQSSPRPGEKGASAAPARVAIAGATGFTGQELLRLLSRHPSVRLTAAMSSGATASRKLPGLARFTAAEPWWAVTRPPASVGS